MPRRGWTVIPIFGRSMLPATWLSSGGELGFNLGKLFRSPLNLRSLEPVLRGEEPVATRVDQDYGDRKNRVVEGLECVAGRKLRQAEQDCDEADPDHGDPSDQVAPPTEMPWAPLELLAREQPQKNRDSVGDVEADYRDRRHSRICDWIPQMRQAKNEGADSREPDRVGRRARAR